MTVLSRAESMADSKAYQRVALWAMMKVLMSAGQLAVATVASRAGWLVEWRVVVKDAKKVVLMVDPRASLKAAAMAAMMVD